MSDEFNLDTLRYNEEYKFTKTRKIKLFDKLRNQFWHAKFYEVTQTHEFYCGNVLFKH